MSNLEPSRSWTGRVAGFLERSAGIAIRLGRNGIVLVAPLLLGYVILGTLLTWIGLLTLPYPFLSVFESRLEERVVVDTRIVFGASVSETIVETADEVEATAIAFRSRGGGRLARLLSGNTTARLVTDPKLPVLSLAEEQPHVMDSAQPQSESRPIQS